MTFTILLLYFQDEYQKLFLSRSTLNINLGSNILYNDLLCNMNQTVSSLGIMGPNWGPHWNPSVHHNTMVLGGFKGAPKLGPYYSERR